MGKFTRNNAAPDSLQSRFHRIIKHFLTKKHQGLVMQAFRDTVAEPNPQAVKFAEAICEVTDDNEFGCCLHCGHGSHSKQAHAPDCMLQEARKYLGRDFWVAPPEPKYPTRKVCAVYLQPGMFLVVDDTLAHIRSIQASAEAHPAFYDVGVELEGGIHEHYHFTHLQDVYIWVNEFGPAHRTLMAHQLRPGMKIVSGSLWVEVTQVSHNVADDTMLVEGKTSDGEEFDIGYKLLEDVYVLYKH